MIGEDQGQKLKNIKKSKNSRHALFKKIKKCEQDIEKLKYDKNNYDTCFFLAFIFSLITIFGLGIGFEKY